MYHTLVFSPYLLFVVFSSQRFCPHISQSPLSHRWPHSGLCVCVFHTQHMASIVTGYLFPPSSIWSCDIGPQQEVVCIVPCSRIECKHQVCIYVLYMIVWDMVRLWHDCGQRCGLLHYTAEYNIISMWIIWSLFIYICLVYDYTRHGKNVTRLVAHFCGTIQWNRRI